MGKALQKGIEELDEKISDLSVLVIKQIKESVRCFVSKDLSGAANVIANDLNVNKVRWEIEELCVYLIATQQPVALDLRKLISGTHVAVELERMGDYAEGVARVTKELPLKFDIGRYPELKEIFCGMEDLSSKMLEKSIEAFFTHDKDKAVAMSHEVCEEDDAVDELCAKVYDFMHHFRDRRFKDEERKYIVMRLSWIAHNLERIADRATNIAERTIYLVIGKMEEIKVSRF